MLVSKLGLREVATGGMLLSAFSFLGLALTDFNTQQWLAWGLMTLLGFSVAQRAAGLQLRHYGGGAEGESGGGRGDRNHGL